MGIIHYIIFSYKNQIIIIIIYRIQGTKVIDDECDYYQSNNIWFTAEQREKLRTLEEEKHKKKHMSHLNKKICAILDFTGRIIEENLVEEDFEFSEEQLQDISESLNEFEISNVCPNIEFKHPMVKIFINKFLYICSYYYYMKKVILNYYCTVYRIKRT